MEEYLKITNTYDFLVDLIYDITEDYRINEDKEYNIDKTITNLIEDDDFWQMVNDYVWKNIVEKKGEEI